MSVSNLGKWVDQVFEDLFYQSDDSLSLKTFEENTSADVQIRINGGLLPREVYKSIVMDSRSKNSLSVQTNRELLAMNGDGGVGVDGSVSHISTFAVVDKKTGTKVESTSVSIISTSWRDGKRVITELTEILS